MIWVTITERSGTGLASLTINLPVDPFEQTGLASEENSPSFYMVNYVYSILPISIGHNERLGLDDGLLCSW